MKNGVAAVMACVVAAVLGYSTNCAGVWPAGSVGYYVCNPGTCGTNQIFGLSNQTYSNVLCKTPGGMLSVAGAPRIVLTSGAEQFPYGQTPAALSLINCAAANYASVRKDLTISSALRMCTQQHILYQWYLRNKCQIPLAAVPGTSTHESGLAFDVYNYNKWKQFLIAPAYKFEQMAGDLVHFTYMGTEAGIDENGGQTGLRAFQALWNSKNPVAQIAVTGIYDDATGRAIDLSPAAGFSAFACAPF